MHHGLVHVGTKKLCFLRVHIYAAFNSVVGTELSQFGLSIYACDVKLLSVFESKLEWGPEKAKTVPIGIYGSHATRP